MELDHVLIAATDLEEAAREFERHGLSSVEGGRHRDWGTANRIVPLGNCYIELIAVVDEAVAAESAFGRWVKFHLSGAYLCTPSPAMTSIGPRSPSCAEKADSAIQRSRSGLVRSERFAEV